MGITVRGIKAVKDMLGAIVRATKVPRVTIELDDEFQEQKAKWLMNGTKRMVARDFGYINAKVINAMGAAWLAGLIRVKAGADPETPGLLMGKAYLKILIDRIAFSGGDVHNQMAKLKPATIAKKKGSTRLFFDTGAMLRAFKGATINVELR